jgi:hypothetical protein
MRSRSGGHGWLYAFLLAASSWTLAAQAQAPADTPAAPAAAIAPPAATDAAAAAKTDAAAPIAAPPPPAPEAAPAAPAAAEPAAEPMVSWGLSGGPWSPWTQIEQPDRIGFALHNDRMQAQQPPGIGLMLHGGGEYDVGYAKWTYGSDSTRPNDFYDMRGRFVLGAGLQHDFGNRMYLRAVGEAVMWVREEISQYQVNADDVYVRVGAKGIWDFQVGRFLSWRVYQKGLGYDLYTIEDTGAIELGSYDAVSATFYPHTYEVNDIFMRGTPGRAAFHLFPTKWSGIEILGQYGKNGRANALGGRVAAGVAFPFLAASAGAEITYERSAVEQGQSDPNTGVFVECTTCGGKNKSHGYGGSAVFKLAGLVPQIPLEIAGGVAERKNETWDIAVGTFGSDHSGRTRTYGGFAQLDVGTMTFKKGLILGVGLQHTEVLEENNDFYRHQQNAYYVAWPLGFNNAMLKFVFSTAKGNVKFENGASDSGDFIAGRLRFSFSY